MLYTTRDVGSEEDATVTHLSRAELIQRVTSAGLVAPSVFGGEIYAWHREDLDRLRSVPAGAVLSVRPYTALLLSTFIPQLCPIWLFVTEEQRYQRLAGRSSSRDTDPVVANLRLNRDLEDRDYEDLFHERVSCDDRAVEILVDRLNALTN